MRFLHFRRSTNEKFTCWAYTFWPHGMRWRGIGIVLGTHGFSVYWGGEVE